MSDCLAYHGLQAYRGSYDLITMRSNAANVIGREICGADRPIGPVGITVAGSISSAYDRDVWSKIDRTGKRYIDRHDQYGAWIDAPTGTDWVNFADTAQVDRMADRDDWDKHKPDFGYCEAWIAPTSILSVWITERANKRTLGAARILAHKLAVPIELVGSNTRIYDHARQLSDIDAECDRANSLGFLDF